MLLLLLLEARAEPQEGAPQVVGHLSTVCFDCRGPIARRACVRAQRGPLSLTRALVRLAGVVDRRSKLAKSKGTSQVEWRAR